jgi:hypothetical protein
VIERPPAPAGLLRLAARAPCPDPRHADRPCGPCRDRLRTRPPRLEPLRRGASAATSAAPPSPRLRDAVRLTASSKARRLRLSSQPGMTSRSSGAFPRGGSLASFPPRNRPIPPPPSPAALAVGQRVFVHCPDGRRGSVPLLDQNGKHIRSAVHLADGVEVEVVAWQPVAGNAHYRVRAPSTDADGWLSGGNLRNSLVPLPPPERLAAHTTAVIDPGERPFGQRSHTRQSPASGSPTTAEPALDSDDGRRGFGQHFDRDSRPPTQPAPAGDANGRRRFGQQS